MLRRLETALGRLAIPHLAIYLIAGQVIFYVALIGRPELIDQMVFVPGQAVSGKWWLFLTFLFIPPTTATTAMSVVFLIFGLYLFWIMGTALENHWGTPRFNLFMLVGYVATIAASFIDPAGMATNGYLLGSVFLAFAYLYPDFTIMLFFILPVKIKWLALASWVLYAVMFFSGGWQTRLVILAAASNFLLFLSGDVLRSVRGGARRMRVKAQAIQREDEAFHRCKACGATEKSRPDLEFRYCDQCKGTPCYCLEHLRSHQHTT